MSSFFKKILSPDADKFDTAINNSFIGKYYLLLVNFISKYLGNFITNSIFLKQLDNIYFGILTILIFIIPYVTTDVLGFFASILILISIVTSLFEHKKFELSPLHVPVFVYLAILMISVCFSSLFAPSLKGFSKMLLYICAFFSFFEFLKKNPKKILPIIFIISLSCCLELLSGLKQMIFGVEELASWQDKTTLNPENMINRIYGTLKPYNPNLFAAYILAVAPCIFATAIYSFFKIRKRLGGVFIVFSLIALFTIIQTGCRGAYIGLFFEILFFIILFFSAFKNYFIEHKNLRKILLITLLLSGIVAVALIISSPSVMNRLTSIFNLRTNSSNAYRMNVYISSLKMFKDNIFIGIGTGNTTYRLIYGLYMITGFDALGAYNIYLEMGVESGIFAILTFLWMMILTFIKAIQKMFQVTGTVKLILILSISAIIAMLMHGFFDTIWYRPQLQLLFWLYMAIIAVIIRKGFING